MSNQLPYEEYLQQEWNDLPLPSVDFAWDDMKRRLEEDDDDKFIAWWKRGCLGWALLLAVTGLISWWLITQSGFFSGSSSHNDSVKEAIAPKNRSIPAHSPSGTDKRTDQDAGKDSRLPDIDSARHVVSSTPAGTGNGVRDTSRLQERVINNGQSYEKENVLVKGRRKMKNEGKNKPVVSRADTHKNQDSSAIPDSITMDQENKTQDTLAIIGPVSASPSVTRDTIAVITENPVADIQDPTLTKETKKKASPSKERSVFASAGIAIHQQLPIAGQKLTPYNAQGRKGGLADYIPAVDIRLNKEDRWFIETGFRYGAPQYNKTSLVYDQKQSLDPVGQQVNTLRMLNKTFYHQVPLSFNYHLFPGVSIGTGIVWNKFSSVVFTEEVFVRNSTTLDDTLVSTSLSRSRREEGFATSYFQALVQAEFKWKRFMLGGRYSFGLSPYLKFTLPGQQEQEQRNQSMQLYLRYQFFRKNVKDN